MGSQPNVLVFHKTEAFRHESIGTGIAMIETIGEERGFTVESTEDAAAFTDSGLDRFQVVVFLSTTGDVLDREQELAMERFVERGGGFVGIHAAADTEYEWPWYGELVGAYFQRHPEPQEATLEVVSPEHPIMSGAPGSFQLFDEWYDFNSLPPESATVLVVVDETSYEGGAMGDPHPISWAHESLGGRSFYTAIGHTEESFADPVFIGHLGNAIVWAAGR